MTASVDHRGRNSRFLPLTDRVARLPFWLLAAVLLAIVFLWVVANDGDYQVIFLATLRGVGTTVYVTGIAYTMATVLGLLVGLLRISGKRVIQEVATFYIEIVWHGQIGAGTDRVGELALLADGRRAVGVGE